MATATRLLFMLLLLISTSNVVLSGIFRIAIPQDEGLHRRLTRQAEDVACSDYSMINNPETLVYSHDFQHLKRPWVDNSIATTVTSAIATEGMNELFALAVPGLNGNKIMHVIEYFKMNGCLSFPYGGSVRDQFLGKTPADLDMESNCDDDMLLSLCKQRWPEKSCTRKNGSNKVHIGDDSIPKSDRETDVIDAANWEATFFGDGTDLEYTTNAMAYFADELNIVIDLTGQGVIDTCGKKIRIPVASDMWEGWVKSKSEKIYRFWKLRVKEYKAADEETMTFVVGKAKQFIMDEQGSFKTFYCRTVLGGTYNNSRCNIPSNCCSEAMTKKLKYDLYFEKDFETFWSNTVKSIIDKLECITCSSLPTCGVSVVPVDSGTGNDVTDGGSEYYDNNYGNDAGIITSGFLLFILAFIAVLDM